MVHRGVPGDDRLVDLVPRDGRLAAQLADELVQEMDYGFPKAPEIVRVLEREGDSRDDVRAIGGLAVEGRRAGGAVARDEAHELRDDGTRADIDGQPVGAPGGVAGLDVQRFPLAVKNHSDRLRMGGLQVAQFPECGHRNSEPGGAERGLEHLGYGRGIGQGGPLQRHGELLDLGVEGDRHGESGFEDRDLAEAGLRKNLDDHIAPDREPAGQPVVGAEAPFSRTARSGPSRMGRRPARTRTAHFPQTPRLWQ